MKSIRRIAASALLGLLALSVAGQAAAQAPRALSPDDAALYAAAFESIGKGDYEAADQLFARVSDHCLEGYLQRDRLMGPKIKATFEDLAGWLGRFADLAGAERVLSLAKKRAPNPEVLSNYETRQITPPGQPRLYVSARDAFYSGDPKAAHSLAVATGERWVAGLAAFRLKNHADALYRFDQVAADPEEDPWLRAAAAYWAARSSIALGRPEGAPAYLRLAARWPQSFYGMLAESQLGYEPGAGETMPDTNPVRRAAAAQPDLVRAAFTPARNADLDGLVRGDIRAKRAAALMQIGMVEESSAELKRGFLASRSEKERQLWVALAVELNSERQPSERGRPARYRPFDAEDYPTPEFQPNGGYTVDRALVYALVKQESRFNPRAASSAGAIGLMQVRPGTAADATGDNRFKRNGAMLYDPAVNLHAGQAYIDFLLRRWTRGDMIRTVAAYNGGPGAVLKAEQTAGLDDSLMIVESLPAHQTREYVEKVMANYWTYRRLFGQPTRSLDALAGGAKVIDVRFDR